MSDLAKRLLPWFRANQRNLPWRNTKDPYRVWLSEIMLQQTRVAAVIPYYERFLEHFPTVQSLAEAPESELLRLWAGLGYYSRARNLQKAAREIVAQGGFPTTYEGIRALPGIGDYTAAAVGSISFQLPIAVLDGNVLRVGSRWLCEKGEITNPKTRELIRQAVQNQLDKRSPGDYNQALMELGATICLPRNPKCLICPINDLCCARKEGIENSLPTKLKRNETILEEKTLLYIERNGKLLLRRIKAESRRLAGFWELPEARDFNAHKRTQSIGSFRHAIVNHQYTIHVWRAKLPPGKLSALEPDLYEWISWEELSALPLSTVTKKSLQLIREQQGDNTK